MKHIRKYNESSDPEFEKWSNELDSIVDIFLEYTDEYNVRFETSMGSKILMNYNDYSEKNTNYVNFVKGLPTNGSFFSTTIEMNKEYNYDKYIELMTDLKTVFGRLSDIGWVLEKFETGGSRDVSIRRACFIIDLSFKSDKTDRSYRLD